MKGNSTEEIRDRKPVGDLTCFHGWLASLNRSKVWGWRARQHGLIQTVNICGRLYVSRRAIEEFERRANAGQFAKSAKPSKASEEDASDRDILLQSK